MPGPIPLMVELCAGTAALSLRLHRDGAKPPVSRMGSKSGYASALLRVLGLTPGQRAAAYLWCEPDPGVRLLLHAYRDAGLAKAAAAIIRGWSAEDPRALWERLRAEGPPRLPEGAVEAGEVARSYLLGAWSFRQSEPSSGFVASEAHDRPGCPGGRQSATTLAGSVGAMLQVPATIAPDARLIDPREVARYAQIVASNRLIHTGWSDAEGRWVNTGDGGATFGGPAFASPPERTAEGLDAAPADLPAVVVTDAREVDPREVARWAALQDMSLNGKGVAAGLGALVTPVGTAAWSRHARGEAVDWKQCHGPGPLLPKVEAMPHLAAALIHPDARTIDPPTLPPGTVVFIDPPYVNTTGYAHDLPRAEVVTLARRWAAAGATVAISEAEPIPELVAEGWYSVDITNQRAGQKRTFSKQQAEHVTLNRPPAWVPPVQGRLF